ncbi:MAG TPA: hypothetical protein VD997_09195 [Phycisphaerales bacterium]|nr:hypothetical protein [Phycisphaerales bacterium]
MRLITTKLHRAFPELDRFSDEQCGRFIRATGRSWRAAPHLVVVWASYLLTVAVVVGLGVLVAWLAGVDPSRVDPLAPWGVVAVLVTAGVCLVPAFIVRDRLLRARVRRVLVARSHCVHCRYSLLGMPVGEDCIVVCPECATPTEVDPSLGELETSETGGRRFAPKDAGLKGSGMSERQRRIVKRGLIAAGVLVCVLLPGLWGLYELVLTRQAKAAGAERPQLEQFMALVERRQPAGAGDGTPNAWELFPRVQLRMMDVDGMLPLPKDSMGNEVYADFALIYSPRVIELMGEDDSAGKLRQEQDKLAAEAARARLEKYREKGVFELMDEMAARQRAVRPLHLPEDQPAVEVLLPELGQSRNMARLNAARMHMAIEEGGAEGTAEWLRAFEVNLALSRMNLLQPSLIDQLVGVAISALTYERLREFLKTHPEAATLEKIIAILDRQAVVMDMTEMLEGERLSSLNTIGWVFTHKHMVRLGRWSKGVPFGNAGSTGRVGSWAENRDAVNAYFEGAAKLLSTPLRERPVGQPTLSGLKMVDLMMPSIDMALRSFDLIAMEEAGVRAMVALERFYAAEGRYPATLQELVAKYLAAVPGDAWDGQPLKYRVHAPGQERNGWGYTLYSIGGNGVDDGGRSPGKDHRHSQFSKNPTAPRGAEGGFDFVVNE